MNHRVAVSERLVEQIDAILLDGVTDPDRLAKLGRLGAQLIIQRAVEDEVAAFLGRHSVTGLLRAPQLGASPGQKLPELRPARTRQRARTALA